MPAYRVARWKIDDAAAYKKYTDRLPATIARYGGKVLAVACHRSPEYQEAAAFRGKGAGVELVIVEGGDATPR
jgi:uncharacterized protein (DUF1330 family)